MNYLFTLFFCMIFLGLTAQNQANPCDSKGHHQFDFWLGEWEVYNTLADTVVGYNKIDKILNGCVVAENWTGSTGFEGKSFNTYNPVDSTWNQVWVDQSGTVLHFSGKFADGKLALSGKQQTSKGEVWHTLDFYRNLRGQTVRQVWKMSNDEGANWTTLFDGTYKKKKSIIIPD